ncbi:MAG: hypothetical protein ACHQ7M_10850 [Chloroflexota bacterium]
MTNLLEQAFTEASRLAPKEQEALAAWILEELASEHRWSAGFADGQDSLASLADKALAEHRQGRTQPL